MSKMRCRIGRVIYDYSAIKAGIVNICGNST